MVRVRWLSLVLLVSACLGGGGGNLNSGEIAAGLKEALDVGTRRAVETVSKRGGYFDDPVIKILLPPEAKQAEDVLRRVGAGRLVDELVDRMNRAAEAAAGQAIGVFGQAIQQMTFEDASAILRGPDDAATSYFKGKTREALVAKFSPSIRDALENVGAVTAWKEVMGRYNQIPLVQKVNPDLVAHVTDRALEGLFARLAAEEGRIRRDVSARSSDLLRRVFGGGR